MFLFVLVFFYLSYVCFFVSICSNLFVIILVSLVLAVCFCLFSYVFCLFSLFCLFLNVVLLFFFFFSYFVHMFHVSVFLSMIAPYQGLYMFFNVLQCSNFPQGNSIKAYVNLFSTTVSL